MFAGLPSCGAKVAEASTLDAALAMVGKEVGIPETAKEELAVDCDVVVSCANALPLRFRPAKKMTWWNSMPEIDD